MSGPHNWHDYIPPILWPFVFLPMAVVVIGLAVVVTLLVPKAFRPLWIREVFDEVFDTRGYY